MQDKPTGTDEPREEENNPVDTVEEDEPIYTGAEIVEAMDERDKVERVLYGSQDETVCTWPEGYKPRQALFSCLTCKTEDDFAGVCLGCSTNCHDGHDLVELYTKRKFRCDCGNNKFGDMKCTLFEEKSETNPYNTYNHNFAGTYCACEDTFPGKSTEIMFQCLMCEDWYHLTHLEVDLDSDKATNIANNGYTLVCKLCAVKHSYLGIFESVEEKSCFMPQEKQHSGGGIFALKPDWRKYICSCSNCQSVLETAESTFLLDEDDDVDKYEKQNSENVKEITDADVVEELVKIGGRDAAATVIRGFHELKTNLARFFESKANEVITPDDVHSFFDQIKRPRLDPEAEE